MNKNYKVIKINGFRGLFLAIFIGCCLITGFVVFPGWLSMHVWDYMTSFFISVPRMNLQQGIILWAIIALSIYAINKNRFLVGFSSAPMLDEEQIKNIVNRVKNVSNQEPPVDVNSTKDDSLDEIRK